MSSDPCSRAITQYSRGDISGALNNIERCQKTLRKRLKQRNFDPSTISQTRQQLSKALFFEGQIQYSQKKLGKARIAFSKALELTKTLGGSQEIISQRAQQQYFLGLIHLTNNQIEEAENLLKISKEDYITSKRYSEGIEILFRLVTISNKLRKYDESIEYLQEIPNYKRSVKDKKQRSDILGRVGLEKAKIFSLIDYDRVEKELIRAKKEFERARNNEGIIECLIEMSNNLEKYDKIKALDILIEANELAKMSNSSTMRGLILTKMGINSLKLGKFEKGKTQLIMGLKFRTESGDRSGTAQTLVELSKITLITSRNNFDLKNAEKFATQAFELYKEINQKYGQASTLELLISINTKLSEFQKAREQISMGRKIYSEYNDINGEARMLTQLGFILDRQNNSKEAISVLRKAIKIFEKTQDKQGLAESYHILAMQYKEDNQKAISLLEKSKELYSSIIGTNEHLKPILSTIDNIIESLR